DVLLAFCLANAGGLASQIPGGAGAFDSAMVSLLSPYVPAPAAFGAVLLWRLVYNVGPLLLAGVSLAGFEAWAARSRLAGAGAAALLPPGGAHRPRVLAALAGLHRQRAGWRHRPAALGLLSRPLRARPLDPIRGPRRSQPGPARAGGRVRGGGGDRPWRAAA